jgi:triosephosphate isomerase
MTPDTQVGAGAPRGTRVARRPLIVGNWKLWGTRAQAEDYCDRLSIDPKVPAHVGICPPFTALDVCVRKLSGTRVAVYAQSMHQESSGAFTGEVSAEMLTEIGVEGVLLGHSERRQYYCETDRALQEKVPAALDAGLQPILCVGESEEEREREETQRKLRSQVQEALEKVSDELLAEVVIAYEPIWAIGTGKVATPEIAQDAIAFIRALVGDRSREAAQGVRILYGGSVKPDNAAEILAQPDVDGALVGGASLDPEGFARIVAVAAP